MGLPTLNTIPQAAAKLCCKPSNVYALVASGELGHYRVGAGKGGIRVADEQIEEFLSRRAGGGGAPGAAPRGEQRKAAKATAEFTILDAERLKEAWRDR